MLIPAHVQPSRFYLDWLSLHPTGRLILSARSLTELLPYLRETFAEEDDEDIEPRDRVVVFCNYCTKIVTSVSRRFLPLLARNKD